MHTCIYPLGFPCGSVGKNPPAMRESWVRSLGWEDPLEKGKATHSSILAWRIPGTVQSMRSRVRHDWATFPSLSILYLYSSILSFRPHNLRWKLTLLYKAQPKLWQNSHFSKGWFIFILFKILLAISSCKTSVLENVTNIIFVNYKLQSVVDVV